MLLTDVSFRFTIGAATPLEKKKTGPSQADVEAIKVLFSSSKVTGFNGLFTSANGDCGLYRTKSDIENKVRHGVSFVQ